jgi:chromosome segregation ATPase
MSNEDGYYVQECKHLRAKLINLSCDLAETTKSLEAAQDQRDRFAAEAERLQELAVSTSKEGTSFYYKEAFESGQTELRELRAAIDTKDERIADEASELGRARERIGRLEAELETSWSALDNERRKFQSRMDEARRFDKARIKVLAGRFGYPARGDEYFIALHELNQQEEQAEYWMDEKDKYCNYIKSENADLKNRIAELEAGLRELADPMSTWSDFPPGGYNAPASLIVDSVHRMATRALKGEAPLEVES